MGSCYQLGAGYDAVWPTFVVVFKQTQLASSSSRHPGSFSWACLFQILFFIHFCLTMRLPATESSQGNGVVTSWGIKSLRKLQMGLCPVNASCAFHFSFFSFCCTAECIPQPCVRSSLISRSLHDTLITFQPLDCQWVWHAFWSMWAGWTGPDWVQYLIELMSALDTEHRYCMFLDAPDWWVGLLHIR